MPRFYIAACVDYEGVFIEATAETLEECKVMVPPSERMVIRRLCTGETGEGTEVSRAVHFEHPVHRQPTTCHRHQFRTSMYPRKEWIWQDVATGGGD